MAQSEMSECIHFGRNSFKGLRGGNTVKSYNSDKICALVFGRAVGNTYTAMCCVTPRK